jgi:hypothetical protein
MENGHLRIELDDGQWVEIRTRTTLGDLEYLETKRLERGGKTSPTLSTIDSLDRIITSWSFDVPVSAEAIREKLPIAALAGISDALKERESPNSSRPSSSGSPRRAKKETSQ